MLTWLDYLFGASSVSAEQATEIIWRMIELKDLLLQLTTQQGKMMATLDDLKVDFESYKQDVDGRLAALAETIQTLTAGQLDQSKLDAIDAEIKAARNDLNPPQPATPADPATPSDPAAPADPTPADPAAPATDDEHVRKADQP